MLQIPRRAATEKERTEVTNRSPSASDSDWCSFSRKGATSRVAQQGYEEIHRRVLPEHFRVPYVLRRAAFQQIDYLLGRAAAEVF